MEEDEVLEIKMPKKNGKKRNRKIKKESFESPTKRVKFAMDRCQTREFYQHGKVATKALDDSVEKPSPKLGIIRRA